VKWISYFTGQAGFLGFLFCFPVSRPPSFAVQLWRGKQQTGKTNPLRGVLTSEHQRLGGWLCLIPTATAEPSYPVLVACSHPPLKPSQSHDACSIFISLRQLCPETSCRHRPQQPNRSLTSPILDATPGYRGEPGRRFDASEAP
jgi:hypothetical protein